MPPSFYRRKSFLPAPLRRHYRLARARLPSAVRKRSVAYYQKRPALPRLIPPFAVAYACGPVSARRRRGLPSRRLAADARPAAGPRPRRAVSVPTPRLTTPEPSSGASPGAASTRLMVQTLGKPTPGRRRPCPRLLLSLSSQFGPERAVSREAASAGTTRALLLRGPARDNDARRFAATA